MQSQGRVRSGWKDVHSSDGRRGRDDDEVAGDDSLDVVDPLADERASLLAEEEVVEGWAEDKVLDDVGVDVYPVRSSEGLQRSAATEGRLVDGSSSRDVDVDERTAVLEGLRWNVSEAS